MNREIITLKSGRLVLLGATAPIKFKSVVAGKGWLAVPLDGREVAESLPWGDSSRELAKGAVTIAVYGFDPEDALCLAADHIEEHWGVNPTIVLNIVNKE
jgi:hypothetical protein